jgi:ubiquinol-cytochrome c reductase cytochrome b subunit
VAPMLFGAILLLVPFFNTGERSVSLRPWAPLLVVMIVTVIVAFWAAGERAAWSPDFAAKPLSAAVVRDTAPQVVRGAELFYAKGCEFCHRIAGEGGERGPDLTNVAGRMTGQEMGLRITNGGPNMPAYAATLSTAELQALVAFLMTRK